MLDNYEPAKLVNPEIHVRYGLQDGKVANNGQIKADNGWLYITEIAIGAPTLVSKTLPVLGSSAWGRLIEEAGLKDFVDGLKDCTL